jgi:hypothetical protein
MRLAHKSVFLPETRTGLVVDQGGMWILVSRGDVSISLASAVVVALLTEQLVVISPCTIYRRNADDPSDPCKVYI